MAALPFMRLYVSDYQSDTVHLTTEEHGAYLLLIMNYWQTGKPIAANRIQAAAGMRGNERWEDVERTLKELFSVDNDGTWHHKRVELELQRVREKSVKAVAAGKKSAALRRERAEKTTSVEPPLNECPTPAERTLNHTDTDTDTDTEKSKHFVDSPESSVQILNKTAPTSNSNPSDKPKPWPDQFDEFWTAFDHKSGKQAALRTWGKIPKRERDLVAILAGARSEAELRKRLPPDRTPKMAQGWLSERRWQDEIYTEPISAQSPEQSQAERVAARIKARENLKVINE